MFLYISKINEENEGQDRNMFFLDLHIFKEQNYVAMETCSNSLSLRESVNAHAQQE